MTTFKVKFRPSTVENRQGSLYFQIIRQRHVRNLPSPFKIYPHEWDSDTASLVILSDDTRAAELSVIRDGINKMVERLKAIERRLSRQDAQFSSEDIIDEYHSFVEKYSLFNLMERQIAKFEENGQTRTAETYQATLNSFKRFRHGNDVILDSVSPEVIESYEAWLKKRGLVPNTVSFYLRILRAIYNRAIDDEEVPDQHPFRRVYTGVSRTVKRALPISQIKKIKMLELTDKPSLDIARDMFIMSFYLRGMSFIDMAFLKKSDLVNGHISYRRRKTGQHLIIKWTSEMQSIVDKYPNNSSEFLLPIIRVPGSNVRSTYRNMAYRINKSLKVIAGMLRLQVPLTLYVARHSWASAARTKGIPISVISEGMGHERESTTRIYLASLESSLVDQANQLIISSLRHG